LYPATLLNLFMVSGSFLDGVFWSLRHKIMLSANRDILTISLPICVLLLFLLALLLWLRIPGLC
jgi:hypothetical protein